MIHAISGSNPRPNLAADEPGRRPPERPSWTRCASRGLGGPPAAMPAPAPIAPSWRYRGASSIGYRLPLLSLREPPRCALQPRRRDHRGFVTRIISPTQGSVDSTNLGLAANFFIEAGPATGGSLRVIAYSFLSALRRGDEARADWADLDALTFERQQHGLNVSTLSPTVESPLRSILLTVVTSTLASNLSTAPKNVLFWHIADMLNAPTFTHLPPVK